jgi:hypothetical protein
VFYLVLGRPWKAGIRSIRRNWKYAVRECVGLACMLFGGAYARWYADLGALWGVGVWERYRWATNEGERLAFWKQVADFTVG